MFAFRNNSWTFVCVCGAGMQLSWLSIRVGALADAGLTPQCGKVLLFYIFRVSFKCKLNDGVRTLSSVCALRILSIISRSIDWTPQNILGQSVARRSVAARWQGNWKQSLTRIRKSYPQEWVCCLCKKRGAQTCFYLVCWTETLSGFIQL